jgi:thiamine pyrophosphokinase
MNQINNIKNRKRVCWIIGASPCSGFEGGDFRPEMGDYVIAADGGLRHLEAAGVKADMIVGDFDTLGYEPDHDNVVRLSVMKDWTDTFVAMEKGMEMGYENFVFYGCLGGKLEHTIANLQHLVWLSQRGLSGWMTDGRCWLTAITGNGAKSGHLTVPARKRGMISVFCMGDKAEDVTLSGLKYGLAEGELTGSFPLGVSNEFVGEKAEISVRKERCWW